MGAIEGIGQSKLGEYIESKLTERDPGGVPQAHVGKTGAEATARFFQDSGGVYLADEALTQMIDVSATLDSVIRGRDLFLTTGNDVFARVLTTSGYIFLFGGDSSGEIAGAVVWRFDKSSFSERFRNYGGFNFNDAAAMSAASFAGIPETGSSGFGLLYILDEATALTGRHQYDPPSGAFRMLRMTLSSDSVWIVGFNASTLFYLQLNRSDFLVAKAKTVAVTSQTLNTTFLRVVLAGTTLIVLGRNSSGEALLLAIDTATDALLWGKRLSSVTMNDIGADGSHLYVVGAKSGAMFLAQFALTDGVKEKTNKIVSSGSLAEILVSGADLWIAGHQSTQTFGSTDHQIFKASGISDSGEALTINDLPTTISALTVTHSTPADPGGSPSDNTSLTITGLQIAETTFTI